jgi:hypothetical protein
MNSALERAIVWFCMATVLLVTVCLSWLGLEAYQHAAATALNEFRSRLVEVEKRTTIPDEEPIKTLAEFIKFCRDTEDSRCKWAQGVDKQIGYNDEEIGWVGAKCYNCHDRDEDHAAKPPSVLLNRRPDCQKPKAIENQHTNKIEVYFAPGPDPEKAILAAVSSAKREIKMRAYSFTRASILDALKSAVARGVVVELLADADSAKQAASLCDELKASGATVLLDSNHPISHDKIIVIDGETVLTGSYNFTSQAVRNAENLLVIHDKDIASQYLADHELHKKHSK